MPKPKFAYLISDIKLLKYTQCYMYFTLRATGLERTEAKKMLTQRKIYADTVSHVDYEGLLTVNNKSRKEFKSNYEVHIYPYCLFLEYAMLSKAQKKE